MLSGQPHRVDPYVPRDLDSSLALAWDLDWGFHTPLLPYSFRVKSPIDSKVKSVGEGRFNIILTLSHSSLVDLTNVKDPAREEMTLWI